MSFEHSKPHITTTVGTSNGNIIDSNVSDRSYSTYSIQSTQASSNQCKASEPASPIVSYSCGEVMRQIYQELHHLSIDSCEYAAESGQLTYQCKHIFHREVLTQLLTGGYFLASDPTVVEFTIDETQVKHDDLFIRAGLFVRLLKSYMASYGLDDIKKKYFETNTYLISSKLGVKINTRLLDEEMPLLFTMNSRSIVYIKLRDCLEVVYHGLIEFHRRQIDAQVLANSSLYQTSFKKAESLRQCAYILSNKVSSLENQIAEYLTAKIQSPLLSYSGIEAVEALLANFILNSESRDAAEAIRKKKRREECEDDVADYVTSPNSTLQKCLMCLQEVKKLREM